MTGRGEVDHYDNLFFRPKKESPVAEKRRGPGNRTPGAMRVTSRAECRGRLGGQEVKVTPADGLWWESW